MLKLRRLGGRRIVAMFPQYKHQSMPRMEHSTVPQSPRRCTAINPCNMKWIGRIVERLTIGYQGLRKVTTVTSKQSH